MEWITLGIGALGGSLIGAGVTLYTYHHKLRDERRNRDRDKKQQAYTQYAQFVALYFNELLTLADVHPILKQLQDGERADAGDVQELQRVYTRAQTTLEKMHDPTDGALNEIFMIAPKDIREAATDVFEQCWRLVQHLNRDELEEVDAVDAKFTKLLREFRAAARADLGVRE